MKVFTEQQKFTQPLVIIALSIALLVSLFLTFKDWNIIVTGNLSDKFKTLSGLLIVLLVIALFINLKLKTRIDERGIYYQFFPAHIAFKFIDWKDISSCTIRKYDPISEYGGWGIKINLFKNKETAFTTKGTIGLQLELTNGKKILIGTQKKEALQRTLESYQHKLLKQ
ncbi:hypothetical protein ACFQ5N_07165 [Lutibacter holmesii]|uniref:PH domain-containing protein n=1 Tax=Lutibacter holmesii TaxID=1137985 RepID=A0ABW3WPK0_9FLAO